MKNLSIAVFIGLLLSSCVSPEMAYEEQQKKNRCVANGGRVVDNVIAPQLMQRCIPSYEWKASDRKIAECRAAGNYYKTNYEGLFEYCVTAESVAASQEAYRRAAQSMSDSFKNSPCIACGLSDRFGNDGESSSPPSYSAPSPSYKSPSSATDWDWDWDYQPANGQWVCRGIQTGRYASPDRCAMDLKDDNRWPG